MEPFKVKGVKLYVAYSTLVTANADHPDVKDVPNDELLAELETAQADLIAWSKSLSKWNPPMLVDPHVEVFREKFTKLRSAIKVVAGNLDCFQKLTDPAKKELESTKRHWRGERDKITDSLKDDHSFPVSMAKVTADVFYNSISPAEDTQIKLLYPVIELGVVTAATLNEPFFVPAHADYSGPETSLHEMCWTFFDYVTEDKDFRAAREQLTRSIATAKVCQVRFALESKKHMHWPLDCGFGELPDPKPFLQLQSCETFDASLRAYPVRLVAGMLQVTVGNFLVLLLPPDVCLSHSNLPQYVSHSENLAFAKQIAVKAGVGSSVFVPFGWCAFLVAISKDFEDGILGADAKKKAWAKKRKKPGVLTCEFVFTPLLDATRDIHAPEELRTVAGYTWSQAKAYLIKSWQTSASVASYWEKVSEGVASATVDKPAA